MIHLAERHLATLREILAAHASGWEARVFGSRVTGTGHEGSDLDLALFNPASPEVAFPRLAALRTIFSQSDLPFLIDLHDWASLPPSMREEIEKTHERL